MQMLKQALRILPETEHTMNLFISEICVFQLGHAHTISTFHQKPQFSREFSSCT